MKTVVIKEGFKAQAFNSITVFILTIVFVWLIFSICINYYHNYLYGAIGGLVTFIIYRFAMLKKIYINGTKIIQIKFFMIIKKEIIISEIKSMSIIDERGSRHSFNYTILIYGKDIFMIHLSSLKNLRNFIGALEPFNVKMEINPDIEKTLNQN